MNILELIILLIGVTLYGIVVFSNFKYLEAVKAITILLIVTLLVQAFIEKPKWTFAFFYIISLLFIILMLIFKVKGIPSTPYILRIMAKVICGILIVATVLLVYSFPVPKLTKPEGNYDIGTTTFEVIDQNRGEIYSDNKNESRRFKVQVWYPAQNVRKLKPSPWLLDGKFDVIGLSKLGKVPSFMLSQLKDTKSNSYENANISQKENTYPVIILSHGWTSSTFMHTNMAENLASNGYIVMGIEHTYGSLATVFADGKAAYFNANTLAKIGTKDFMKSANTLVNTFSSDIEYILNNLENYNKGIGGPKVIEGKLALDKIGLLGHSTGGGAGVLTTIKDSRVKAVLGYDPWVEPIEGKYIEESLKVPSLFFRSDEWKDGNNNNNLLPLVENNSAYSKLYGIEGTKHNDFTIMYLISPVIKKLNGSNKIDGDSLSKFQSKIDVAFFDYVIKEKSEQEIDKVLSTYSNAKFIKSGLIK